MIKKIAVVCVLSLLLSSAGLVFAGSNSNPESPLYPLRGLIEVSAIELTNDNVGTALWALQFAESRIDLLDEEVEKGRPDFVDLLLQENEAYMNEAQNQIENAEENEYDENLGKAIEQVSAAHERRQARLKDMIESKDIPEAAKDGMGRALENQERAFENFMRAMDKAQEARENGEEENGNGENEEGNKPESIPPVEMDELLENKPDVPGPRNGNPNQ